MKFIIKFFVGILNLIYCIFKAFPVKDKVVLISRQSDDISEDFISISEEIKKQSPSTKVVILCKRLKKSPQGILSYFLHLFVQMYNIATSKAVVLDSYCIAVSVLKQRKSLMVIQVWHALGALKKFGLSIVGNKGEGKSSVVAEAMRMHRNYTYVLASGEACIRPYMEAFGCPEESIIIGSLPRVEKLLSVEHRKEIEKNIFEVYPSLAEAVKIEKEIIVYAPTFRVNRDISAEIKELIEHIKSDSRVIIVKKHPLMELTLDEIPGVIIDNQFDTVDMMTICDWVIGDYSAIIYEAALLNKKMCFYAFDFDEYADKRDFYLDYEKEIPGEICKTKEEVLKVLEVGNFDYEKSRGFTEGYIKEREGSTAKLAKLILNGKKMN